MSVTTIQHFDCPRRPKGRLWFYQVAGQTHETCDTCGHFELIQPRSPDARDWTGKGSAKPYVKKPPRTNSSRGRPPKKGAA